MLDLVRFCDKYQLQTLKIAPICDFGDTKIFGIKQPLLEEYVDYYCKAYELGQQYGVDIAPQGKHYLTVLSKNKMRVPLVWLPDGYVAMHIAQIS